MSFFTLSKDERKQNGSEFEKRKKVIYDFICDDFYIPMKVKEIATVLQVSKEQRRELQEVLDALVEEGKITLSKEGNTVKVRQSVSQEPSRRISVDLDLLW